MNPIFTMPYSEYSVAQKLKQELNCSVFIPLSAQEKGIDLLLYKFEDYKTKTLTVQVKNSRSYKEKVKNVNYYGLWFNSFKPQSNAQWFILTGAYPQYPDINNNKSKIEWKEVFLAFRHNEMEEFIGSLKQKKDNTKADKMFGFRFNAENNKEIEIWQTRGYHEDGIHKRQINEKLLENRIDEMKKDLSGN